MPATPSGYRQTWAGYLTIRKTNTGRRRHTHLRLTRQGRAAFDAHARALQSLIAAARTAPDAGPPPARS
ncbi:MAG TPA: transcriptional regulator [Planosporangium sp.]|nr:transcriptional regulator [Planosporangium sp.]